MNNSVVWPEGKQFAFTVFDDTDGSTLERVREVYSLLTDYGFQTTKSVWPIRGKEAPLGVGSTCEDQNYLGWLKHLQNTGFEIGYHMSTFNSSVREETISGIEKFANHFGYYPKSMANHVGCLENIYWGSARLSGSNRFIYNLLTRNRRKDKYQGHIERSRYFWGDICKEKIKYVRNFVFPEINTLSLCPVMPYHDLERPYVNYWFASSDGSRATSFNKCISEENQDRLEEEGGACIMYAHFAFGFYEDGRINSRFKSLMARLSQKNGWFVPVSALLDFLLQQNGGHIITDKERTRLERKWLLRKIVVGTT
jgi:hypothetical protein